MNNTNKIKLIFSALSKNEAFARNVISCFALSLNPSVAELSDIKTAVSEAVTNSIVHGYEDKGGKIVLEVGILNNTIDIKVVDNGIGINDIDMAIQPFFTTKTQEEHSGMGFTLMDSFMSSLEVKPNVPSGLIVKMQKVIKGWWRNINH